MSTIREQVVQDPAQENVDVLRYVELAQQAMLSDGLVPVVRVDASTAIEAAAGDTVIVSSAAGATAISLPAAAAVPRKVYVFLDTDVTGSKGITVTPDGTDTINAGASLVFANTTAYERCWIINDGATAWYRIG